MLGRLRSDRVMYFPAPPRQPGTSGRPIRHGAAFKLADPATWPAPAAARSPRRPGTAPRGPRPGDGCPAAGRRAGWEGFDGELPIVEGALIRLQVQHLPGDRSPDPLWLWSSRAGTSADQVDRAWQAFLRRFDIEHTFRFLKQVLGWTCPKLRDPAAADRWTWIVIACYAQLWLARGLAEDLRLPWQRPCPPGRLTPARAPRVPEHPPGTARSGQRAETRQTRTGRRGSKNRHPATRHDVGKTEASEKRRKGGEGKKAQVAAWNLAAGSAGSRPPVLHFDVLRPARSRTSVSYTALVGVLRPPRAGRQAPPPPHRAARACRASASRSAGHTRRSSRSHSQCSPARSGQCRRPRCRG